MKTFINNNNFNIKYKFLIFIFLWYKVLANLKVIIYYYKNKNNAIHILLHI